MGLTQNGEPLIKYMFKDARHAKGKSPERRNGHFVRLEEVIPRQTVAIVTRWYVRMQRDKKRCGWLLTVPCSFYRRFNRGKHQPLGFYGNAEPQSKNPPSLYRRSEPTVEDGVGELDVAASDKIVPLPATFNTKKLIVTETIQDPPVIIKVHVYNTGDVKGVVFPHWPYKFFMFKDEQLGNQKIRVSGRHAYYLTQHVLFNLDCNIVVVPKSLASLSPPVNN
ncbi:hypothetical protein HDV00_002039, partial [Rhizophlyctis rosea]